MKNADYWIEKLNLIPLPGEGGYFREVYKSNETLKQTSLPERFTGDRSFSTSIYYLLNGKGFSAFHRLRQEEIWHFYEGAGLIIHIIDNEGKYEKKKLGPDFDNNETYQVVVKRGDLYAATLSSKNSYCLVGCTVAPGFEFEDWTCPVESDLVKEYPQHKEIIKNLSRL
ncbi:MAG: cupin domain-containing protein [bacterium]|nr:cupin domain-containing protein [bacterium]